MKKIIVILLCLLITSAPVQAAVGQVMMTDEYIAENRDMILLGFKAALTGYSDAELQLMMDGIEQLLIERNEEKGFSLPVKVPAGDWIVGEDIPAGTYSVKMDEKTASMIFWVYDSSNGRIKSGSEPIYEYILTRNNPTIGKIKLERNTIVRIHAPIVLDRPVSLFFD